MVTASKPTHKLFSKLACSIGTYQSPDGQIDIDRDRLKHWEKMINRVQKMGYKIPIHFNHSSDPEDSKPIKEKEYTMSMSAGGASDTTGYLDSFRVDGDKAEFVLAVRGDKAIDAVAHNDVFISPVLFDRFMAGNGEVIDDMIGSVDLVDYPVDFKQEDFVPVQAMSLIRFTSNGSKIKTMSCAPDKFKSIAMRMATKIDEDDEDEDLEDEDELDEEIDEELDEGSEDDSDSSDDDSGDDVSVDTSDDLIDGLDDPVNSDPVDDVDVDADLDIDVDPVDGNMDFENFSPNGLSDDVLDEDAMLDDPVSDDVLGDEIVGDGEFLNDEIPDDGSVDIDIDLGSLIGEEPVHDEYGEDEGVMRMEHEVPPSEDAGGEQIRDQISSDLEAVGIAPPQGVDPIQKPLEYLSQLCAALRQKKMDEGVEESPEPESDMLYPGDEENGFDQSNDSLQEESPGVLSMSSNRNSTMTKTPKVNGKPAKKPAPSVKRMSAAEIHLVRLGKESLKKELDSLLENGRCDPADHKSQIEMLGRSRMSLTSGGTLSRTDVHTFIESRRKVPVGTFWSKEKKLKSRQRMSVSKPGGVVGDASPEEAKKAVDEMAARHPGRFATKK